MKNHWTISQILGNRGLGILYDEGGSVFATESAFAEESCASCASTKHECTNSNDTECCLMPSAKFCCARACANDATGSGFTTSGVKKYVSPHKEGGSKGSGGGAQSRGRAAKTYNYLRGLSGLGYVGVPGMHAPGFPDRVYSTDCKPKDQDYTDAGFVCRRK